MLSEERNNVPAKEIVDRFKERRIDWCAPLETGRVTPDGSAARVHVDRVLAHVDVAAIRAGAANPAFLGGILDHLLADESLLLIFAEEQAMRPERIAQLRRKLPGAAVDF